MTVKYSIKGGLSMLINLGLSKTGTKSLAKALSFLGYKVTKTDIVSGQYEALVDIPCIIYYPLIKKHYPDHKLIMTPINCLLGLIFITVLSLIVQGLNKPIIIGLLSLKSYPLWLFP